ncbi:MAG: transcription elongation factor GreA [Bdellovibrionaceae bacterium]|nr:transcription elongation factor GreA [Pseudobdellovibrionaceae bacterium]
MSSDKQPMTVRGRDLLNKELKNLLQVERPKAIKAIEEARGHGDLSENADYDAAKERQGFIESRISEIQAKLASAEVINPAEVRSDKVVFGATVTIVDLDTDKESTYQLVGIDEADIKQGLLSVFSPLGRALIGKRGGDTVEVQSPRGDKEYEIVDFEFK